MSSSASSPVRIMIGTPCYGGMISSHYFHSLRKAEVQLAREGIQVEIITRANESLITRARNSIVAAFLGYRDYSHLLFIDADIGFTAQNILRLLHKNEPLTACACPMKGYDWQRIYDQAEKSTSAEMLKNRAHQFALNLPPGEATTIENGFIEVKHAGTGFMMIRREVFEALIEAFPDLRYENDVAGYETPQSRGNFWAFFDTVQEEGGGRYLSEDYTFCQRWREGCGGKIHLDVESPLTHFGMHAFQGSFLDSIRTPPPSESS